MYFGDDGVCVSWAYLLYIVWYWILHMHARTLPQSSRLGWLEHWLPSPSPSLERSVHARGSDVTSGFDIWEHWPYYLEGCSDGILRLLYITGSYLSPILRIKLERGDFTGARSPITFPMTVGLAGSMSVALNALASVTTIGGGGTLLRSRPDDSLRHSFS